MIEHPFRNIRFDWLAGPPPPDNEPPADLQLEDLPWTRLSLPPEFGVVVHCQHVLALGMALNYVKAEFSQQAFGRLIPGTVAQVEFSEPSFQAVTLRGLRLIYREQFPAAHLAFSEGIDLFRFTNRYLTEITPDGSFSGSGAILSVRVSVLKTLIGDSAGDHLLEQLGVTAAPAITARNIPLHISRYLIADKSSHLCGKLLKLQMQARVLQYLGVLTEHVCGEGVAAAPRADARRRRRAQAIHAQLQACEGKLPSLGELAQQYGCAARLLNEDFIHEYGQTIFAFMVDFRLNQAHAALEHTRVSIKQLAHRLGYTHVSNFTIAFKKKFGYPPGYLRKRGELD